jgi:hypothetical protein
VGFIVTNMRFRFAKNVVRFYNQRGTAEQCIKEGKGAIKWTRLSCRTFAANPVRLQLHALAYNLGNLLRTLATPKPMKYWSLTSLREKLIKIGAKVIRPRSLRRVSNGPGRAITARLCGRPALDRRASFAAGLRAEVMRSSAIAAIARQRERCALTSAKSALAARND